MGLYTAELSDINPLQQEILRVPDEWIKTNKTPDPKNAIIIHMEKKNKKSFTVVNALNMLIKKGFIRKSYGSGIHKTAYVQLRSI